MNYVQKELGNFLHMKNGQTADILLKRIQESERERESDFGDSEAGKTEGEKSKSA